MTLQECTALLTPLALALGRDVDGPTFRAYHKRLEDVPVRLAELAIVQLDHEGALRFLPSAPEIRAASEKVRRQQLALHPYDGCAECEMQPGWRNVITERGSAVEKCPCKGRHQEKLASLGLLEAVGLLPGESGVGESEQVFPTVAQLPAPIREQLTLVAGKKALR